MIVCAPKAPDKCGILVQDVRTQSIKDNTAAVSSHVSNLSPKFITFEGHGILLSFCTEYIVPYCFAISYRILGSNVLL